MSDNNQNTIVDQFRIHPGLSIFYSLVGSAAIQWWMALLYYAFDEDTHHSVAGWGFGIFIGFVLSGIVNALMGDTWSWKKFAGYRILLLLIGFGIWYLLSQMIL